MAGEKLETVAIVKEEAGPNIRILQISGAS